METLGKLERARRLMRQALTDATNAWSIGGRRKKQKPVSLSAPVANPYLETGAQHGTKPHPDQEDQPGEPGDRPTQRR